MDEWMPENPLTRAEQHGKAWQARWTVVRLHETGRLSREYAETLIWLIDRHIEPGEDDTTHRGYDPEAYK